MHEYEPFCPVTQNQFRGILGFVEDDRRAQLLQKRSRIAPRPRLNVGVFEQDVLGLRKCSAKQGRLTRMAGACDNQRGVMTGRFFKNTRQLSRCKDHGVVLDETLNFSKCNKPAMCRSIQAYIFADDRLTSQGSWIASLIVHKLSESTASGFDPWLGSSLVR